MDNIEEYFELSHTKSIEIFLIGTLFQLITAANYLEMKDLLYVACKVVGNLMKGKTSEEIRKVFNIQNDHPPEDEEQLRKENEWCEEK